MGAQALVERMGMDERFELRHEVVVMAEGELEVDPPLDSCLAEPLETLDLALREVVVGEVGECGPPPECKRLLELRGRRATFERPRFSEELLELAYIDLLGRNLKPIARADCLDRLRT